MTAFVAHLDHVIQLVGIDHVGIATDGSLDGRPKYVYDQTDLIGYDRWYRLAASLREARYSDEEIRKVLGLNFVRVLRESIG